MTRSWIWLVLSLLVSAPAAAETPVDRSIDPPEYDGANPSDPPITADNLFANERYWPYQVALHRPWRPDDGATALAPGIAGVLIRIEAPGDQARIDFGRDGLHVVPVVETDLVERANRIRRGELPKIAGNFAVSLGTQLVDASGPELRPLSFAAAAGHKTFLCAFADPAAEDFDERVKALAPLRERKDVMTVFFPQGEHPDAEVRERLRSLDWPVAFLYDHLSEIHAGKLRSGSSPALLLLTREGRVLSESAWTSEGASTMAAALGAVPGAFSAPLRAPSAASAADPPDPIANP